MGIRSVEEYLDSLNENGKIYVKRFMEFMVQEYPQYTVRISFSMPMWWKGEKMKEGYTAVSAAGNHVTVHFSDEAFVRSLGEQFPDCKTGKRCINIRYQDEQSFLSVLEKVKEFLG